MAFSPCDKTQILWVGDLEAKLIVGVAAMRGCFIGKLATSIVFRMNPSITVIGRNGSGKKDGLNNICSIETHEVAFGAEITPKTLRARPKAW